MSRSGLNCLDLLKDPVGDFENHAKKYIGENRPDLAKKELERIKDFNPDYKVSSKLFPIALSRHEKQMLELCSFDGKIAVDQFIIKMAISKLIHDNVNLNVRDNYGRTPIGNALYSGDQYLAGYLELKGAIPNDNSRNFRDFFNKAVPRILRDN